MTTINAKIIDADTVEISSGSRTLVVRGVPSDVTQTVLTTAAVESVARALNDLLNRRGRWGERVEVPYADLRSAIGGAE